MITYFYNGDEYTTRQRLLDKYSIPSGNLQRLLENHPKLTRIQDGNTFFYLKSEVEDLVQTCTKK